MDFAFVMAVCKNLVREEESGQGHVMHLGLFLFVVGI